MATAVALGLDAFLEAMERAVARYGADYRDPNSLDGSGCRYEYRGYADEMDDVADPQYVEGVTDVDGSSPAVRRCIIGQTIVELGLEKGDPGWWEEITNDNRPADDIGLGRKLNDSLAAEWAAAAAQRAADNGATWGGALEAARLVAAYARAPQSHFENTEAPVAGNALYVLRVELARIALRHGARVQSSGAFYLTEDEYAALRAEEGV